MTHKVLRRRVRNGMARSTERPVSPPDREPMKASFGVAAGRAIVFLKQNQQLGSLTAFLQRFKIFLIHRQHLDSLVGQSEIIASCTESARTLVSSH